MINYPVYGGFGVPPWKLSFMEVDLPELIQPLGDPLFVRSCGSPCEQPSGDPRG